ncbi:hypothetical protein F3Y22_tig00110602pilonHSYRG00375 [Hibiscus syriacus]|uniref:Uncharacterized protein n=1 Tax=Hibiscus syriacus TaxID=106335 RepID=A0A6A3A1P5_HIBSY|nr:hypothetical protein F3Y22_tig00110602pilonHSYRG00375 [Hibiscus syriacus]
MNTNAVGRLKREDLILWFALSLSVPLNGQSEMEDSDVGTDLLDLILSRRGYGSEESTTKWLHRHRISADPHRVGGEPFNTRCPIQQRYGTANFGGTALFSILKGRRVRED